ncbi:hypothetical protein ABFX02_04G097500 [Erythranthe guttata]
MDRFCFPASQKSVNHTFLPNNSYKKFYLDCCSNATHIDNYCSFTGRKYVTFSEFSILAPEQNPKIINSKTSKDMQSSSTLQLFNPPPSSRHRKSTRRRPHRCTNPSKNA